MWNAGRCIYYSDIMEYLPSGLRHVLLCVLNCAFCEKNRKIFIQFFIMKRQNFGGKIKLFPWTYGERDDECDIMLCVVFIYYLDYDFFITHNCLHLPSYGVWYSTNRLFEPFVMKHLRVNVLTILQRIIVFLKRII